MTEKLAIAERAGWFEIKRKIALPNGGSITVTVRQPEPINESEFRILNPQNATAMADWMMDFAETLKPGPPESRQ
jgi:hypothetical protein